MNTEYRTPQTQHFCPYATRSARGMLRRCGIGLRAAHLPLRAAKGTPIVPPLAGLKVAAISRSQHLAETACDPWPRHTFSRRARM